jgi:hypothetical protein
MIILVPPQVYVERLNQGVSYNSYLDFYSTLLNGTYPNGNLSWHHLWFIVYLFFYTLILTPLFIYIRNDPGLKPIEWLNIALNKYPFVIAAFPIPLIIIEAGLYPVFGYTLAFWGDWYALSFYGVLFFYGFVLITLKNAFWKFIEKYRLYFLISALLLTTAYFLLIRTEHQFLTCAVRIFNLWSWVLLLLGYSVKFLNKPGAILKYRNEAVYPFYILHHTVLLVLGFYVVDLNLSILLKFLILVTGTFGITWLVYELIIRRFWLCRLLFGVKLEKQSSVKD